MMNAHETDSIDLVGIAVKAIADKKGNDTVAFDVRALSNLTDVVVITSGLNPPHLKALFNETRLRLKKNGISCYRKAGAPDSGWIVADYLDIIIHFFIHERRDYYALDELFEDAPKLKL